MHFCDALFAAVETALNAVVDGAFKRLVELEWEKRNDARHQRHPHQRVACIVTDVQFLHLEALNNIHGIENKSIVGEYEEDIVMMMYDEVVITKKSDLMSDDFPLI